MEAAKSEKQKLIALLISQLCKGLPVKPASETALFYLKALDDLSEKQLRHGFEQASRHLGKFLPAISELREWSESWRPPEVETPQKPLEPAHLAEAAHRSKVTKEEIVLWLEDGKQKQREHIAKLAADPKWQAEYEKFGKLGLPKRSVK